MTAIDTRIFQQRSFSGSPDRITPKIRALAREISPDQVPVFVACEPDGQAAECFFNVQRKVERSGGDLLNGWVIWEWRSVYIEAEHHAVWCTGDTLVDLTPHLPLPESRVLFVPDPERHFDFAGLKRLPNVVRPLGLISAADDLVEATKRLHSYMESCSNGRKVTMQRDVFQALGYAANYARGQVLDRLARITRPNDTCICRSGLKFKKCCSPFIKLDA